MILTLTNCLTYTAFWSSTKTRNVFVILLAVCQAGLLVVNMIPAFSKSENEGLRQVFYGSILASTCVVAVVWLAFLATSEEVKKFLPWLCLALFWLGIGMFFYAFGYPERAFPESRFVAYWLSSHTWWHICAALSAN